ncbi:hypothetical protein P261_02799 [Lachnospiraceae bacterium TWA4]|nr:hypothetical protein P261_02799 [Lachnospiraceae bacterium TWA4]
MKQRMSIGINRFVGIMSFIAWLYMVIRGGDGQALTAKSIESLKYFTVLSNLFNGVVSFTYSWWLSKGSKLTANKKLCKLISTTAVGLTFITVIGFLGPLYGYGKMFQGANFWLHLVLPVLSMASYMFFEEDLQLPFKYTVYPVLAPLAYGIGYVGNVLMNVSGRKLHDFYGFFLWGNKGAVVAACVVLLITWLIAVILNRVGYYCKKYAKGM